MFPGVHRSVSGLKIVGIPTFSSRFLAFPGTVYLSVFSAHRLALLTYSHPVFEILLISLQSHDLLATKLKNQGTKAHSLSHSKQQKQNALLILKIWFSRTSVAMSTIYRCTVIHIYYALSTLTLFWLAESVQWIFEINAHDVITTDYTIIMRSIYMK